VSRSLERTYWNLVNNVETEMVQNNSQTVTPKRTRMPNALYTRPVLFLHNSFALAFRVNKKWSLHCTRGLGLNE
jgi:hypothetical protein